GPQARHPGAVAGRGPPRRAGGGTGPGRDREGGGAGRGGGRSRGRGRHRCWAGDQVKLTLKRSTDGSAAADAAAGFLVCRGVDVAYDKVQVLFGVDLEMEQGEIIALLGTNGAGKSTLLKAISGLVEPAAGRIFFDGQDITKADAVTTSKLGIIQVPGGKAVFPTLTVAEHFK